MKLSTEEYDELRSLEEHRANLEARSEKPKGDCELCAMDHCKFNITRKIVLDNMEHVLWRINVNVGNVPNIKQYSCPDAEDDRVVFGDLRNFST